MKRIKCIAWDFDGVLNKGIENGQYVWQNLLSGSFGIDQHEFARFIFGDGFWPVMRGEIDIVDHLEAWKSHTKFDGNVHEILQFWFENDAKPCPEMMRLMDQVDAIGLRQVIATNNEHRRSRYIERDMGFSARVETVFSSGRMKIAKPDAGYFKHIEKAMGLDPEAFLFVDDYPENIEAAAACGWQVHLFPEDGHSALQERLSVIL